MIVFTAENLGHSTNKGNSLARSNASLYGNKEELYDRLRRHAYQGKKGKTSNESCLNLRMKESLEFKRITRIFRISGVMFAWRCQTNRL